MKHFGRAFTELLFRSGLTQKSIGDKIGTSHVTVTRWKEQPSIDAATLEKLCRIFNVPITFFFDSDVCAPKSGAQQSAAGDSQLQIELLRGENAMLQKLIDEKERTIQILMKQ